ncbi:MAG: ubiquinone/menaquinone biosynthesis methyltransferase [Planctomycetota bacterium]|jgi:demethylmenaquinone methyltransferase/2-methoxy-6-polyprenyl-1,4-benzoquinol methylase
MTRRAPLSSHAVWTANDLTRDPHAAADKAERVQRMFASIASRYDLNNRVHSLGRDQAWRRAAVRLCRVQPSDEVLDAACGTGDLAEAFAAGGAAAVTGVDFAAPMLAIAREKAARRRHRHADASTVAVPRYVLSDINELPFEAGSFDIVSIAFGIRNVAEPRRTLAEFRRLLRPGGRLVILEFSEPGNAVLRWLNRMYTWKVMPLTATLLSGDRSGAYRYLPRSVMTFLDREQLASLIVEVGFASVSRHPMTFGVCVAYLALV